MTIDQLTANDLIKGYLNRSLSPAEVVDELFNKIADRNTQLNAFVTLNEEAPLQVALRSYLCRLSQQFLLVSGLLLH